MIIPVRCFTCGRVLADKYQYYIRKLEEKTGKSSQEDNKFQYTPAMLNRPLQPSPAGQVLNDMHIIQPCCRRSMLTHKQAEH